VRVAIVGARRVRQGLGPFLARFCIQAGADVVAVLGTTRASAEEAAAQIGSNGSATPIAYTDAESFHAHEGVDALLIASPHETHLLHLQQALERGRHVLCEKPLVWGTSDPAGAAARLAAGFGEKGLHLRVNTQWPWTLPTFRCLHPDAPVLPQRFRMIMPPRLRGLRAMLDSLSHPLSLLATLLPDPRAEVRDVTFMDLEPDSRRSTACFAYSARGHTIDTEVVLDSSEDPSRTTRFSLDDYEAARTVDPATYSMTMECDDRRIPLPDPTPRLVGSFLEAVASRAPVCTDPAVVPGMRHLVQILEAAATHLGVALP
jgi:hypothetical protein